MRRVANTPTRSTPFANDDNDEEQQQQDDNNNERETRTLSTAVKCKDIRSFFFFNRFNDDGSSNNNGDHAWQQ